MKRFGVALAIWLVCTLPASAAKVQVYAQDADAAWQTALKRVIEAADHNVVESLSSDAIDQIVLQGATEDVSDLSGRIEKADYIIRLKEKDGSAELDLISLAEGSFVARSYAKSVDMLSNAVEALFARADVVETEALTMETKEGTWVETTVIGRAKKGTSGSMATKIALMDAKRNAVDRVIGAAVAIEGGTDKKVTANLSGRLKYTIMDQGKDAKGPFVKIRAGVYVPTELAGKKEPAFAQSSGMAPLAAKFDNAVINWGEGFIEATGQSKGSDGPAAKRAAYVVAQANALSALHKVAVDAFNTVGEAAARDPQLASRISGVVQGAQIIDESSSKGKVNVTIRVPLYGVRGVQSALIDPVVPTYSAEDRSDEGEYSGVVIDMRGQGGVASMFPQIVDDEGQVVFDPKVDMDPHARQARGFAAYSVGEMDGFDIPEDAMYIKARAESVQPLAMVAALDSLQGLVVDAGESLIVAQARRPRPVRSSATRGRTTRVAGTRQGSNARTVRARPAGRVPTNIVFSTQSSNKKSFYAKLKNNLRKGRVVILTDTAIGGVEGKRKSPVTVGALSSAPLFQ